MNASSRMRFVRLVAVATACVASISSAAWARDLAGTVPVTVLYSFYEKSGGGPYPQGIIQAKDGNFYGTTTAGGTHGSGSLFRIAIDASTDAVTEKDLYSFVPKNGVAPNPNGGLIQGADGSFYGTTLNGGPYGVGTVFRISIDAATGAVTEKNLHSFGKGKDGSYAGAGVVQGADGAFYGTTEFGGSGSCSTNGIPGCGTVFRLSIDATTGAVTYKMLYSFQNDGKDGYLPAASLVQGSDGDFYGTTSGGGAGTCSSGCGTVFRVSINATTGKAMEKVLYSFQNNGSDGNNPDAALIQGTDGNFYGTTFSGGAYQFGTVFQLSINSATGAVTETPLYSFQNGTDGAQPPASLVQGSGGGLNFYGVDQVSGAVSTGGALFELVVSGSTAAFSVLYDFGSANAEEPIVPNWLIQGSDGNFYGTTLAGGTTDQGTFFKAVF